MTHTRTEFAAAPDSFSDSALKPAILALSGGGLAWIALRCAEAASHAHAIDGLLASAWCGDGPSAMVAGFAFGHCAYCWGGVSSALASVGAFVVAGGAIRPLTLAR